VRVGLEDAPLGTTMGNLAWVEEAVRLVREAGAEPATGADVRLALATHALA
jgi:3-keto-5-aminohexanoate cleavage enzyme